MVDAIMELFSLGPFNFAYLDASKSGLLHGENIYADVLINPHLRDQSQLKIDRNHQKDQIILAPGRGILADFWVPHEIESCNFQNLLVFGFPETSQNLI